MSIICHHFIKLLLNHSPYPEAMEKTIKIFLSGSDLVFFISYKFAIKSLCLCPAGRQNCSSFLSEEKKILSGHSDAVTNILSDLVQLNFITML